MKIFGELLQTEDTSIQLNKIILVVQFKTRLVPEQLGVEQLLVVLLVEEDIRLFAEGSPLAQKRSIVSSLTHAKLKL